MKLADEILAGPSFEEAPEGVLADESRIVANAKKNLLQAAARYAEIPRKTRRRTGVDRRAFQRGHGSLRDESCLLRTQKAAATKGESACATMIDPPAS